VGRRGGGDDDENATALVEVEIPTGRPHQIRIHMSYAGYPLVGDPLYLPGGIPDASPRTFFEARTKDEEDRDTDGEDEDEHSGSDGETSDNKTTAGRTEEHKATTPTAKRKKTVTRVALPRDCGYYLHAHRITLEHPFRPANDADNDGNDAGSSKGPTNAIMTFTATLPPLLRHLSESTTK